MKKKLIVLLLVIALSVHARAPDAEYYIFAELHHSTLGVVCTTERYEFHTTSDVGFSEFSTFDFSCSAPECKWLLPGEECWIEIQTNHPDTRPASTLSALVDGDVRAQRINANHCENCGVTWDLENFCAAEGPVSLRLEATDEDTLPDGSPDTFYLGVTQDCRPGVSCTVVDPLETTSDTAIDSRTIELLVSAPGIAVDYDGVPAHCDCFVGETCAGGSCFDASVPFESGTTGPCCGDDVAPLATDASLEHESFAFFDCPDTWDPNDVDTAACTTDVEDAVCCNHAFDCVYGGVCYTDDQVANTIELHLDGVDMSCSQGRWCPLHFAWNEALGKCDYQSEEVCFSNDPNEPDGECAQIHGTPEYWNDARNEEQQDCFDETAPEVKACCPFVDWKEAVYYKYDAVVIY